MGAFEYRQALEIRDAFKRHDVKYLFIGKSGAILLGFPDTTQETQLLVEKSAAERTSSRVKEGPFDLDLIFAPDGIEKFEDAWKRRVEVEGFPVCNMDDIISSKQEANRQKDKESLPRLISFREWMKRR